jgi:hypothetical protein
MVHEVDEAQVEPRFGPFRDSAKLDTRLVHSLRRMYHRLGNHFCHGTVQIIRAQV